MEEEYTRYIMFEYAIEELRQTKLACENIANAPISSAISEYTRLQAHHRVKELEKAIQLLKEHKDNER